MKVANIQFDFQKMFYFHDVDSFELNEISFTEIHEDTQHLQLIILMWLLLVYVSK